MSVFRRLFKIGQAEAHATLDKMEDPVKMTEQGVRDLKNDLNAAMTSLAEVKGIAMRTRREAENNKKLAAEYERKAMMLLTRMKNGELEQAEADRLATEALNLKERYAQEAVRFSQEAERHEGMAAQLQASVNKIKSTVTSYENDLVTLKARAKTASSTRKINQQLANIDTTGTVAMLEKMKQKVEEDESLALAYGEMANTDRRLDDEINAALNGPAEPTPASSSIKLLELKQKMGIS